MSPARRTAAALSVFLFVAAFVPAATADDIDDDLSEVREQIQSLSGQIDSATASRSSLAGDVKAATARMDEVLATLEALRDDLGLLKAQLVVKERALSQAQARLHEQYQVLAMTRSDLALARADAASWAIETYMSAGSGVPDVAFSATAWNDVILGIGYLEQITENGIESVGVYEALLGEEERAGVEIEATEAALAEEVISLEVTQGELEELESELDAKSEELAAEVERQRTLLASVVAEISHLEGELAALEKEESSIRAVITERSAGGGRAPGRLVRPVSGAISSGFGARYHPILGYTRMHNGVDMNCGSGDSIAAAEAGVVILTGVKGGFGNTVMIDHGGGMVTLYAHQSGFAVSTGQTVSAGQVVGYCGSTGLSTSPHLHFEVRMGGDPKNPANYL